MKGKKHCIVFAMLVGLGALVPGSAAWAQGYNYEQDGGNWGGSKIGPLGQCFACGARYYRGYRSGAAYPVVRGAYASTSRKAPLRHGKHPVKGE